MQQYRSQMEYAEWKKPATERLDYIALFHWYKTLEKTNPEWQETD